MQITLKGKEKNVLQAIPQIPKQSFQTSHTVGVIDSYLVNELKLPSAISYSCHYLSFPPLVLLFASASTSTNRQIVY